MSVAARTPAAEPESMYVGAGTVYFNYELAGQVAVGDTKGGSVFTVEREIRETEGDSEYGPMMGHRRKDRVKAMLKVNMLELNIANVTNSIPGVDVTDQTSYWEMIERLTLSDSDYLSNVAIVFENYDEGDMVIILSNVLADENLELALAKNEDVVPEITFVAHYDRDTPTVVPYEIRLPQDDTTPPTVALVPADAAAAVAVDAVTTATFNEAMDISTLNAGNLILMEADGTAISSVVISVDATKKIVTFTHTDYSAATAHILIATTGCKDLSGNALAANNVSNFTTA